MSKLSIKPTPNSPKYPSPLSSTSTGISNTNKEQKLNYKESTLSPPDWAANPLKQLDSKIPSQITKESNSNLIKNLLEVRSLSISKITISISLKKIWTLFLMIWYKSMITKMPFPLILLFSKILLSILDSKVVLILTIMSVINSKSRLIKNKTSWISSKHCLLLEMSDIWLNH